MTGTVAGQGSGQGSGAHHLALLAEAALERLGDYDQLLFEGTWHSSGEIMSRARRVATGLAAMGVEPGDRVVVMTMNTSEVFVAYHAIWRAGAVVTPVIFLQNVVVDFLMGLGFKDAFRIFAAHVKEAYGAEPGFITMNLPRLLDLLEELRIDNPIVCANINKIGFRMCGGIAAYERALAERRCRPIAMSVLASGAIPAKEAIDYVCGLPNLQAIVFGASSRGNIHQTRQLVDAHWGRVLAD